MSQTEDQLDSGAGITDLVFDAKHQERQSWRFCNSRLPRSEVVYFTQIIIIIFPITVSLTKLFSTELIFKMLLVGTFFPEFQTIFYFYQHDQPKFQSLEKKLNIHFKKFSNFELNSELENCLLVFDDSCEEIFNDKKISKLATAGRHRNISVIYVKHNLFQQSRWSRTIDLNTTHIILFKSPRDTQQISFIGRQLNNAQFLKESYELATKEPFGHLLVDLDPKTSDVLRYCSNIVPPGPSIFYLPSAKAVITNLSDERERSLYAGAAARHIGYKTKREDRESSK